MPVEFLRRRAPEQPIAPNIGANDQPFYDLVLDEEESDDDNASIYLKVSLKFTFLLAFLCSFV